MVGSPATCAGATSLYGNAGNDAFNGGAGGDFMDAGAGHDRLSGASGRDTFVIDGSGSGTADILDFSRGDVLVLNDAFADGGSVSVSGGEVGVVDRFDPMPPVGIDQPVYEIAKLYNTPVDGLNLVRQGGDAVVTFG